MGLFWMKPGASDAPDCVNRAHHGPMLQIALFIAKDVDVDCDTPHVLEAATSEWSLM